MPARVWYTRARLAVSQTGRFGLQEGSDYLRPKTTAYPAHLAALRRCGGLQKNVELSIVNIFSGIFCLLFFLYLICRIFDWQIIFLQKKIACRIYAGSIAWIFVCILDVIMLYFLIWETKDRKGGLPPLLHYLFYFTGGGFIAFS